MPFPRNLWDICQLVSPVLNSSRPQLPARFRLVRMGWLVSNRQRSVQQVANRSDPICGAFEMMVAR